MTDQEKQKRINAILATQDKIICDLVDSIIENRKTGSPVDYDWQSFGRLYDELLQLSPDIFYIEG